MKQMNYAVEMTDICKSFGAVQANKNVNFRVLRGEIHAIVGENGAGKTTLMNILFGVMAPSSGRIRIHGEPVTITSSNKAIRLGIGMVHQHFELVPDFTVAENICLGHEPRTRFGAVDRKEMLRYARELSENSGLKIIPEKKVKDLSVGLRQRVEILKALSRGADILILDEPTAVLTPHECDELFSVLRKMAAQNKTIIIITHKLKEVMQIADHVTVLSRGETKGTLLKRETDEKELAGLMMGKAADFEPLKKLPAREQAPRLTVRGLQVKDAVGLNRLNGVSFDVRPGEILTVAGVEGNGQSELVSTLLGFTEACAGEIAVDDVDITHMSVKERRDHCSFIPEDRMSMGLDLACSVHDNLIAGIHCKKEWDKGPFIDYKKTRAHAAELIDAYAIKTDGYGIETSSLSGGNQQKLVVAREMFFNSKVMVIAQPSRGVDISATRFIHEQVVRMRNAGCAIVLISTDLDEVLLLSDRIKVLFEGEIVATLQPGDVTPEELGLYMTGSKRMRQEGE